MSRRKPTLSTLKSSAAPARPIVTGRTSVRRGRTLALATTLTLAAAGIGATAWLTNAQEPTSVTTTATADANVKADATTRVTARPATASPQAQPAAAQQQQQPSAPSTAGQRAFIDPVTGQLRQPEHDELAAIAAAAAAAPARRLARTAGAAPEFFDSDGAVGAVVPEDLHTFTVATRGPDGRITIEHATGAKDAVKVMKANSAKKDPQPPVSRAPVSRAERKEDRNDR